MYPILGTVLCLRPELQDGGEGVWGGKSRASAQCLALQMHLSTMLPVCLLSSSMTAHTEQSTLNEKKREDSIYCQAS